MLISHLVDTQTYNIAFFADKQLDQVAMLIPQELATVDTNVFLAIVLDCDIVE
jgi:hypothetical protein